MKHVGLFRKIINFYIDGFKSMTLGKPLWIMIILKVLLLIVLMKVLFFPDFLGNKFDNDDERSSYVRHSLGGEFHN